MILVHVQSWALLFCQSPFYVKIDSFWARDLISCVNGCFWPKWRWVNSFFDFCPFRHTFLTFFENPKKPKMSFFELETWFFGGREVFDQHEQKAICRSVSWALLTLKKNIFGFLGFSKKVRNVCRKGQKSKNELTQKCPWLYLKLRN